MDSEQNQQIRSLIQWHGEQGQGGRVHKMWEQMWIVPVDGSGEVDT